MSSSSSSWSSKWVFGGDLSFNDRCLKQDDLHSGWAHVRIKGFLNYIFKMDISAAAPHNKPPGWDSSPSESVRLFSVELSGESQLRVINPVTSELIPLWDTLLRQHVSPGSLGTLSWKTKKEITLHGCDIHISWAWRCRIDWITQKFPLEFLTSYITLHVTLSLFILDKAVPTCVCVCVYCAVILIRQQSDYYSSSNFLARERSFKNKPMIDQYRSSLILF